MTKYLIALYDDGNQSFPEEELPDVVKAVDAVCQEIKDAGHWVFGGGLTGRAEASVVSTEGVTTDGPYLETKEYLGGFSIVDVPDRGTALAYAAKLAVACRCAQEVREFAEEPGEG